MKLDKVIMDRIFKTVYEDGEHIIYVYKDHVSKSQVFSETLNQARAEELGYSVPKVVDVRKVEDKWAVVTETFQGVNAYDIMTRNKDRVDECLDRIIQAQIGMHAIECDSFISMTSIIDDAICSTDLSAVGRFYLHGYLSSLPRKRVLCHGDLNPKNIFLKDDGGYCVVDWKYASEGDPDCDSVVTYLELLLQFDEEIADKYLNKYIEKTAANRKDVEKWIPVCAAFIISRHQFDNDQKLARFLENY